MENEINFDLRDILNLDMALEHFIKVLDEEVETMKREEGINDSIEALQEGMHETYRKIQASLSPSIELIGIDELEDEDEEEYELADNSDMLQIYDINIMRNIFTENVRQMTFDRVIERLHELGLHDVVGSEEEIRKMLVGALMQDTIKKGLEKGYL